MLFMAVTSLNGVVGLWVRDSSEVIVSSSMSAAAESFVSRTYFVR